MPAPTKELVSSLAAELSATLARAEAERDARCAFLAHIANELRTPLTALAGMADMLTETWWSAEQRDMVRAIHRGAQHVVRIVDNVLDLSRLESDQLELDAGLFRLRAVVEESLDALAAEAADKGLELAYGIDSLAPDQVLGDGSRVRQVLANLIGNAVKFTTEGEVVVTIDAHPLPGRRHQLHFAVRDTGSGIPADRLEVLFDKAPRDVSAWGRAAGYGLGLAISRRVVAAMGGELWAESAEGEGSTVHFTIVAPAAEGPTRLPTHEPALAGKRILIIDSNLAVGSLLADMVGRWGIEACATAQTSEVFERLRGGKRYDGVLIDRRLPGRRSLASQIQSLPGYETIPLVLLTSVHAKHDDAASTNGAGRARFAAYLNKPVRLAQLHDVLVRVLAPAPSRELSERGARARQSQLVRVAQTSIVDAPDPNHRWATLAGARVVVADDDPGVRRVLRRALTAEGADVTAVGDGAAALVQVRESDPDVVLLDVNMPQIDGFEVCRRIKADPATLLTPVILITGLQGKADGIRGIEAGADDFLTKPWEDSELLARVRALVRLKRFTSGLDRPEAVLVAMARCLESRDPHTQGHCERLSDLGARLGRRIGLDELDIDALRLGGIMHDIGKVAVPDAILFKTGPLTDREWGVMRRHPEEGERICGGLAAFRRALPIIRHHHERLDGSGYPDGLRGEEIPVTARVLQTVDVYDALTRTRPYKPAMTREQALAVMQAEADRGWRDREILGAFREIVLAP